MKKRYWIIPLVTTSVLLVSLACIPLSMLFKASSKEKEIKKSFTEVEVKEMKNDYFNSLNQVAFPSMDLKEGTIDDSFKDSVLSFTDRITSATTEFSYSPLSLYNSLDTLSYGTEETNYQNAFDSILGKTREERQKDLKALYPLDYYLNENGTLQRHQGIFYRKGYTAEDNFLSKMTERFSEAYSVDFDSEKGMDSMLSWIDQRLNEKGFLDKSDLPLNEETMALLFDTLYFESKWKTKYKKNDTKKAVFTSKDGKEKKIDFMNHNYYSLVYEYDTYYSFYDYYKNGESIQYLVPKDNTQDIRFLVKDTNFYKETKEGKESIIDLTIPKFTEEKTMDFLPLLKKVNLGFLTDETIPSLNGLFSGLEEGTNIHLDFSFQKNKVTFDEDGTVVKSLTVQGVGKSGSSLYDCYQFRLDHPFIYTIYDRYSLPIYTSYVSEV